MRMRHEIQSETELPKIGVKANGGAGAAVAMAAVDNREAVPFPERAWRGIFADYRTAMNGTTEASDVAHFATLWTAVAASLGRKVYCFSGDRVYPNVYICIFGSTGDKKTTAMRRLQYEKLLSAVPKLHQLGSVGSTEGFV